MIKHHYAPWGGHPGSSKLLKKLAQTYFWPQMRQDVRKLSANCLTCARRTSRSQNNSRKGNLINGTMFDMVALDLIGPFEVRGQKRQPLRRHHT